MDQLRLVFDTNVVISAALRRGPPYEAIRKAREEGVLLVSKQTLAELHEVLLRKKFDPYVDRSIREGLFQEYARNCRMVEIRSSIRACRDPRDDKFLELAVHGSADVIITGDDHLLALHPFQGIQILTPADFLRRA